MITVKIGAVELKLNKNEVREVQRMQLEIKLVSKDSAQRSADIFMRSAYGPQVERRKAAVRALGLSDTVAFL